jgi:two-component system sensor histidine kinase BaeS
MFKSLASRAALLTGSIAALAVLIAGLVALPLIRSAAESQVQANLASQANLVRDVAVQPNDFDAGPNDLDQATSDTGRAARALQGVVIYLRDQGVEVQAVIPGQSEPTVMSSDQVKRIANGLSFSARNCLQQECVFLEGRPVGTGTGIVLTQPVSVATTVMATAIGRIVIALVVGFIAAMLLGLYAARKLTKPLGAASSAAHEMAAGERDLRLVPQGPIEIAEIAIALNVLAEELQSSEGRQREFLMSVSHELRTPLTAIRGYAEAMSDGMVPQEDQAKVGTIVVSEALRLDRLVSDLLDLARTGAVDFPLSKREIDLSDVVLEASDVWADRAARVGVLFSSEVPEQEILALTDPIRVRQIIDNLAENALRVTPSGEQIVLALSGDGIIQVRDSGPGLSADDIEVAFEPGELFERYKGVRQVGTGFGLALVGRLSSRLGASAKAGVSPEGGAAFSIDFSQVRVL